MFFRHPRVGYLGKKFDVLKFRSMAANTDESGPQITVASDQRITRAGRFLRNFKLDELPQLVCVLKGDMSLVGPRPEVPKYVDLYPPDIRDVILSVRPGITDLASIEYRDENALLEDSDDPEHMYVNEILPAKLEYYVAYVRDRNFLLDLRIIFQTLRKLAVG